MANENDDAQITDSDKLRIVADFILHAPPGEFREVFSDIRHLLNNDDILKGGIASNIFAQYRKEQLTPVALNANEHTLITNFNDLGSNRFYDPKSRKSFRYDYLTEEIADHGSWEPEIQLEPWRQALDDAWTSYCSDHYYNGTSAVFAAAANDQIILNSCIEAHQFQPNNYWNGLWRSTWSITVTPGQTKAEVFGKIRAQVHYYENGNVQLVSSKEIKETVNFTNEKTLAENFKNLVEEAENEYQIAISKNYQNMSDTTFKALRRALPVTRSKIDWHKIMGYRIGSELKQT